jgi:putative transposase
VVTELEHICSEAAQKIGNEVYGRARACSVATYYRWLALYGDGSDPRKLDGEFDNRGNKGQLDDRMRRLIIQVMAELLEQAKYRKKVGNKPLLTMREIVATVKKRLEVATNAATPIAVHDDTGRQQNDSMAAVQLPSRSTFYKLYNTFPAYLRDVARHGLTRARSMYRRPGETTPVLAPLSCLQFDETRLPLIVVHEELKIPLGRPWLAWYVDEYSDAINGFYLGFTPPGDQIIGATTRHACSMKGYVQQEYHDIKQPYLMGGRSSFHV